MPKPTARSTEADTIAADTGRLVLRLLLGLLILLHGVAKLKSGPAQVVSMLDAHGLPSVLAYFVYVGEVLAPVLLVIGLWTRLAAGLVAVNMLVAIGLAHAAQLFTLAPTGGWALELQGMYFFTAVAIVFLGAGRFSVGRASSPYN